MELESYPQALEYFEESLILDQESENYLGIATSYTNLGKVKSLPGDKQEAEELLVKSVEISQEIDADQIRVLAYESLIDVYESIQDFESAFDLLKKYGYLKDSLSSIESQKIISELETEYELDNTRRENENLKLQEDSQSLMIKHQRYLLNIALILGGTLII